MKSQNLIFSFQSCCFSFISEFCLLLFLLTNVAYSEQCNVQTITESYNMPSSVSRYSLRAGFLGLKVPAFEGFEIQHVDVDPDLTVDYFCDEVSTSGPIPNVKANLCSIEKSYDAQDPIPELTNSTEIISITNDASASESLSAMDLIAGRDHILQKSLILDPFSKIAADMNESGTITTYDLAQIARRILNMDTPGIPIWKTMPINQLVEVSPLRTNANISTWGTSFSSDPFSTSNPAYPDYLGYTEMEYSRSSTATIDQVAIFTENAVSAIKMGDINNSYDEDTFTNTEDTLFNSILDSTILIDPVQDFGYYRGVLDIDYNTTT
jgi:hypothetical protein